MYIDISRNTRSSNQDVCSVALECGAKVSMRMGGICGLSCIIELLKPGMRANWEGEQ